MQVVKRNGSIVDFDQTKIEIAIEKANAELHDEEKATKEEIHSIIKDILARFLNHILYTNIISINSFFA